MIDLLRHEPVAFLFLRVDYAMLAALIYASV